MCFYVCLCVWGGGVVVIFGVFATMFPIFTVLISQLLCAFNSIRAIFADIRDLVSNSITIICRLFKRGYDVGFVLSVISVPDTQMS